MKNYNDKTEYLEVYNSTIKWAVERTITRNIVKKYEIDKLIPNGDKFIIIWVKRLVELTELEYKEKYAKDTL